MFGVLLKMEALFRFCNQLELLDLERWVFQCSLGATIGILIGAIGGPKLATYFREMDLNEFEHHSLRNFVKIEEMNVKIGLCSHLCYFCIFESLPCNNSL